MGERLTIRIQELQAERDAALREVKGELVASCFLRPLAKFIVARVTAGEEDTSLEVTIDCDSCHPADCAETDAEREECRKEAIHDAMEQAGGDKTK